MTTVTQNGTTVDEAIEIALRKLNVSRNEVKVEVLTHGRKGFLGIGAKEAEVKVTVIMPATSAKEKDLVEKDEVKNVSLKETETAENAPEIVEEIAISEQNEDPMQAAEQYLKDIAREMDIHDLEVTHKVDGKYVHFQLESEKAALLIGKRGQTLNAIQQLVQLITNQHAEQFKVVRLNVGDYRERREQSLAQLADRMADRAIKTGRKVQLEPMPAYERKVIHHTLSNRMDIETYSEGLDPHRYLVIEPIR